MLPTLDVCKLLSQWITVLLEVVPTRSRATFVELLIGCMLSPDGWVTRCIGAISRQAHWGTYYKLIERARLSVRDLSNQTLRVVLAVLPQNTVTLCIDDTLVLRTTESGPGIQIHHDHAKKANRPKFVRGQCWVTLAVVGQVISGSAVALPIRSRLAGKAGQKSKLLIAKELITEILDFSKPMRLLVDAWYMRRNLLLPLLEKKIHVIGQVRHDTALFFPPAPVQINQPKKRGRKRIYGAKVTAEHLERLPVTQQKLQLYGRFQEVAFRSCIVKARFLKGVEVRAVWCQLLLKDGQWSKTKLFLSTDTSLTPDQILHFYAQRWGIETLFHNLKRWWGCNNLWQQSMSALELWMQIRSSSYTLMQLLALSFAQSFPITEIAPWRKGSVITTGLFAQWMRIAFSGLAVRHGYNPKSHKFSMPMPEHDLRLRL